MNNDKCPNSETSGSFSSGSSTKDTIIDSFRDSMLNTLYFDTYKVHCTAVV